MENQEHILVKADVRRIANKKRKIILIVYSAIVAVSLIIGFISGTHTYHVEGGEVTNPYSDVYGRSYPAYNTTWVGWFRFHFLSESEGWLKTWYGYKWGDTSEVYTGNIIGISAMYLILLVAPVCTTAIHKRQCKNTALAISESKIFGSYNSFILKKNLEMPIEKVDNLTTFSGLMDKLRTGVTLGICSASGVIKIHFVQNADEVISAAMNRNDASTEKEKRSRVVTQMAATSLASTSDKLKDLLAMKESGLITDDEFTKKREELLSNM